MKANSTFYGVRSNQALTDKRKGPSTISPRAEKSFKEMEMSAARIVYY